MFFSALLVAALATLSSAARKCGTEEPGRALIAEHNAVMANSPAPDSFTAQAIVVPTVFHVLRTGTTEAQGNIPDAKLYSQLDVLNADYASAGISFNLVNITRTTSSSWFNDGAETAMKTALRQGTYKTLNVYFQNLSGGLLGYCYFPVSNPSASTINTDGCSVLYTSVPGGTATNYNL